MSILEDSVRLVKYTYVDAHGFKQVGRDEHNYLRFPVSDRVLDLVPVSRPYLFFGSATRSWNEIDLNGFGEDIRLGSFEDSAITDTYRQAADDATSQLTQIDTMFANALNLDVYVLASAETYTDNREKPNDDLFTVNYHGTFTVLRPFQSFDANEKTALMQAFLRDGYKDKKSKIVSGYNALVNPMNLAYFSNLNSSRSATLRDIHHVFYDRNKQQRSHGLFAYREEVIKPDMLNIVGEPSMITAKASEVYEGTRFDFVNSIGPRHLRARIMELTSQLHAKSVIQWGKKPPVVLIGTVPSQSQFLSPDYRGKYAPELQIGVALIPCSFRVH